MFLDLIIFKMGVNCFGGEEVFRVFIVGLFLLYRRFEICRNIKKFREDCVLILISLARNYKFRKYIFGLVEMR